MRVALAFSAVVQLLLALPFLFNSAHQVPFGMGDDIARLGWEMASFQLALAAGYLGVAWRPAGAKAMLPAAAVLAACLVLSGVRDVMLDPMTFTHHVGHLLPVAQVALMWGMVRRGTPRAARNLTSRVRVAA